MRKVTNAARGFTRRELAAIRRLDSPFKIQAFLWDIPYSADSCYRSPSSVLRDRTAHCFDGALFAAAALRQLGFPPLIVEMLPNERDDDHLIAVYRLRARWGAVAKSNFSGLTFREPVYRDLRELVMSYFEQYYNTAREKTLRGYTAPLDLSAFDRYDWMVSDEHLERVANRLDRVRRFRVAPPAVLRQLSLVDQRSFQAGLLGARPEGLFQP